MAVGSLKELVFSNVVYDKPEVIQGLLRFYFDFKSQAHEDFNEELVCIYVDIDKAISEVTLTDRQKEAVDYYMKGWTEEEIGNLMGKISHQAVHKLVMKACDRISKHMTTET